MQDRHWNRERLCKAAWTGALAFLLVIGCIASAQAPAEEAEEPPERETGVSLSELKLRMLDGSLVKSAIIRATDVLAAADKEQKFFSEGCDKDPHVRDFYRGMILAHAGYYLVMADLRTGRHRNYGFLWDDYSSLQRASLYAYWTKERVADVWRSSNALAALGVDDKRALTAFLNELKSYRAVYSLVKQARPGLDWSNGVPIGFSQIDGIVKRAGHTPINKCYIGDYGYSLKWNVTSRGETEINFFPVDYMVSFWYRRDVEDKTDLADWFLSVMIRWLKP